MIDGGMWKFNSGLMLWVCIMLLALEIVMMSIGEGEWM